MLKKQFINLLVVILWISLNGAAALADNTEKGSDAFGGVVIDELEMQGVVEAVDYDTRRISIKDSSGEMITFIASPAVRNFNQIEKGDKVSLQYQEQVMILTLPESPAVPERADSVEAERAPLGQKPSGTIVNTTEVFADVVAINHEDHTIALKGPLRTVTVKVDNPGSDFDRTKPGDKIYLRFTQSLAIGVTAE